MGNWNVVSEIYFAKKRTIRYINWYKLLVLTTTRAHIKWKEIFSRSPMASDALVRVYSYISSRIRIYFEHLRIDNNNQINYC